MELTRMETEPSGKTEGTEPNRTVLHKRTEPNCGGMGRWGAVMGGGWGEGGDGEGGMPPPSENHDFPRKTTISSRIRRFPYQNGDFLTTNGDFLTTAAISLPKR